MDRTIKFITSILPTLCTILLLSAPVEALTAIDSTFAGSSFKSSETTKSHSHENDSNRRLVDGRGMGVMGPRGEPDAALWSNLAVVLAGFSFMTIVALLQSYWGQTPVSEGQDLRDRDLSVTLSILVSSFLLFLVAADLFSWANGDKVGIRASITMMAANFVVALGMLTINFGMIWAFHLFRLQSFAHSAVRWVFLFMLVYSWSFLIPSAGGVLYLMHLSEHYHSGEGLKTVTDFWYTDGYFWLSCLPLMLSPLIAHFMAKDERFVGMFSAINERPIWAIVSGAFAVALALWVIVLAYVIQYTGNPSDPVNIRMLKMFVPPYYTQAFLMMVFSLIEAVAIFCLPSRRAV